MVMVGQYQRYFEFANIILKYQIACILFCQNIQDIVIVNICTEQYQEM